MIEVIEAYTDFVPPRYARAVVQELLVSVPEKHFVGLRRIVLTNAAALTGPRKRRWSRSRGKKVHHTAVLGLYYREWRGEPAWIELFVDKIVAGPPAWALRLPVVRSVAFGHVLYHELGHHIHTRHRPEYRDREDVADSWEERLVRAHIQQRHATAWRLRPLMRLAWRIMRWSTRENRAKRASRH